MSYSRSDAASENSSPSASEKSLSPTGKPLGSVGRICLITMGCAKNEVDSDMMAHLLTAAGYCLEDDPARADAIIVNTCSFIRAATEESLEMIFDLASLDHVDSGQVPLIVTGCMPTRYGDDLSRELDEACAFVKCSEEDDIVSVVDGCLAALAATGSILNDDDNDSDADLSSVGYPQKTYAYVKISEGCDRCCSYCTIPFIRGRYHSFTFDEIIDEVSKHVEKGAREIVLIAQDTGRWGRDFDSPLSLAWLLDELAKRFEETWFRVMYVQPEGVTDDLLDVIAAHDNICSYLDIPFQHASSKLLKDMNRSGSGGKFLDLITHVRSVVPDVTLRTTLIAGFPGESDEDFEELCDFVEEASFDYVGVFAYSREEGTRAFDLDKQIDEDEKAARAQSLRDLADGISTQRVASRVGKVIDVVIEGRESDGRLFGRAMCQAPEIDGVTYLNSGIIGDKVSVCICDTVMYDMESQ